MEKSCIMPFYMLVLMDGMALKVIVKDTGETKRRPPCILDVSVTFSFDLFSLPDHAP